MSSGIMTPISLDLSQEERRNLVLRMRYGHTGQKVRPEPKGCLLVVGQSVVQETKPHTAPPLSRFLSKSHPELLAKSYFNPMANSAAATNASVSSPSVLPKDSAVGAFGLSHTPTNTKAPPTTPHENKPASGLHGPATFRENGDVKNLACKELRKEGGVGTGHVYNTPVSHGGFGEVSKPHLGRSKIKNSLHGVQTDKEAKDTQHHSTEEAPFLTKHLIRRKSNVTSPQGLRTLQKQTRNRSDQQIHPAAESEAQAIITSYSSSSQGGGVELHKTKDNSIARRSSVTTTAQQKSSTSKEERRSSFGKPPGVVNRSLPARRTSNGSVKGKVGGAVKRRPSKTQDVIRDEAETQKDTDNDVTVFRKFREMPQSQPKMICFDYPGTHLTHVDVKNAILRTVPDAFDDERVASVQFENVNIKLGTGGLPNRWLIELKDFSTRNKLIKGGLTIVANEPQYDDPLLSDVTRSRKVSHVTPKLYDMVTMEEYKLFLRKTAAEEKLQTLILMNAGRGQSLLANML